jgi:nucleotide-binding universal stress UspA family protein
MNRGAVKPAAANRALYLGAAGTIALLRCACGRRFSVDRARWAKVRLLTCDNCRSLISYNPLRVVPLVGGSYLMEYKKTPEREAILAELQTAQDAMARAAKLVTEQGIREKADEASDLAQRASNLKYLLGIIWHDRDAQSGDASSN